MANPLRSGVSAKAQTPILDTDFVRGTAQGGIYCAAAGNIALALGPAGTEVVTLVGVTAGSRIPLAAYRVVTAGTNIAVASLLALH